MRTKTGNSKLATIGNLILAADAESTAIGFVLAHVVDQQPKSIEDFERALDLLAGELANFKLQEAEREQLASTLRSVRSGFAFYRKARRG
jgi:hypothetical protein